MKNEPVAWINKDEYHGWLNWDKNTEMPINIPLYTHPANPYKVITDTKIEPTVVRYTHPVELTDKEINPLWRYRKKGEFDQFSYVEWNDEDSFGYEITMFLPTY